MRPAHAIRLPRTDRSVAAAVLAWRTLTGSRSRNAPDPKTLVACSGGADSTALALALASSTDQLVIAHVVHDMRAQGEALSDRDRVRDLADTLGLPFVESSVSTRDLSGNAEANARDLRYRALADLACEHACPFVATGHHADDQLETVLMALIRGSGPHGLSGIAPLRLLDEDCTLIRPMLSLDRRACEQLCTLAGVAWSHDATNDDTERTRAAIRHDVIPAILNIRPDAARRASDSARLLRDLGDSVDKLAARLLDAAQADGNSYAWSRDHLRHTPRAMVGAAVREAAGRLLRGSGRDALTSAAIDPITDAIRDEITDPRRFSLAGVDVVVEARAVKLSRRSET